MRKLTRTISGVTPVAVMTEPQPCPGQCVYCPSYSNAPRSYTPESPAVIRARHCNYDARKQVELRLQMLSQMGHHTDKIELIVMGGTFLALPVDYQYAFIKGCYDAMNGEPSATLEEAKLRNETARHRCVGLCIETRPDWCGAEEIERMLEFGTTRVELGVQALDDEIYRLVRRGHTVADVVTATQALREHGLKVHYHWMPGLPGSSPQKDLEMFRRLFDDPAFRPDGLKIYPTMVVDGSELRKWFDAGAYTPYDRETMVNLVTDMKALVPGYVRISRVLRDIPRKFIQAGLKDSLREVVRKRIREKGQECRCIRCREYGHRARAGRIAGEPRLARMDYAASYGREIFLSFEDDRGTLYGLLRLRLQTKAVPGLGAGVPENPAIIRELHVYGTEVPLKQHTPGAAQHRGLGKALVQEAERIAREEFRSPLMVVLSGVGVREYYRTEFGYERQAEYMVKRLESGFADSQIAIQEEDRPAP
ncbi:MAG: tRNA uridine(34) 5-carboxymethylaminomethyl modification radical SAM/GNAT enzyme Elp3 [Chloroflexi bacterium]|nr:tRNA uridine(34) 5-carboxymethylaminomethyl modification radical SAM/GNAT enzyme Elp3 [Chloroflexota bacterium]